MQVRMNFPMRARMENPLEMRMNYPVRATHASPLRCSAPYLLSIAKRRPRGYLLQCAVFPAWQAMADIWIKICGIARAEDARAAIDLGADALGLVCYPVSGRYVPPEQFQQVIGAARDEVEVYALFVNPELAQVRQAVDSGLFSGLQFHGDEPAEFCESFGLPYMKALRVRDDPGLQQKIAGFASARRILLDAWDESSFGGTGKSFPWEIAERLVRFGQENIVIAGGLHAGNVASAIHQARPCGVDVSSGVEARPGAKDANKLREFMREARNA